MLKTTRKSPGVLMSSTPRARRRNERQRMRKAAAPIRTATCSISPPSAGDKSGAWICRTGDCSMTIIFLMLIAALVYAPHSGHAATADEIIKKANSLSGSQRRSFLEEGAKKEG